MKKRKQKSNGMIFLRFVVLVLFVAALFVPDKTNRLLIAAIAGVGILGTLLFYLIPLLPALPKPRKIKKRKALKEDDPEEVTDMETLLWRQISYQITGQLKDAYPKATWSFTKEPNVERLLAGKSLRIRTSGTEDYNYAEVALDQYGRLNLVMMTIESLKPHRDPSDEEPKQHEDPSTWYELIGKSELTNCVGDLQAKGHDRLFISDSGEVFIKNDGHSVATGILNQFPSRDYWDVLMDILTQDELTVKETDGMLELSWAA